MTALVWLVGRPSAQAPVPPPQPAATLRGDAELDQLLGPIALYPDPLLALMLPAAEQPAQIVIADRYVAGGGDPSLIDQQPWIDSIRALAQYPAALKMLDDNLSWAVEWGNAFAAQPQDVMASIQRLRAQAIATGTLQSTPEQQVIDLDGTIEIVPADPDTVYMPSYQADQAYVEDAPLAFSPGCVVGDWLDQDLDWQDDQIVVWSRSNPRPRGYWQHDAPHRPNAAQSPMPVQRTVWSPPVRVRPVLPGQVDRGYQPRAPEETPRLEQPSGALIGVESARLTRQYSDRGMQSSASSPYRRAPAPAPAPRMPAPSSRPSMPAAAPGRRR